MKQHQRLFLLVVLFLTIFGLDGRAESIVTSPSISKKIESLCSKVRDDAINSTERKSALSILVKDYFTKGTKVSDISRILSKLTILKPSECEFVRAFSGAWPFDELLTLNGNSLVAFRFNWKEPNSSTVVFLLIEGTQPDEYLPLLFNGKWPKNSRSLLLAASIVMP